MHRLIYRQVIETLRCLDEGGLRTEVEGNVASVVAIEFPRHAGGALQFIPGVGVAAFQARCDELAKTYGERFRVTSDQLGKLDSAPKAAA
jgi:3-hydroxyacyl-CoA dehydrogenase / enoyl-CoA hydratase / 3-hydroxybutyryl-CoA epimerase